MAKHYTFKAAGISNGIKFNCDGIVKVEDGQIAIDQAKECLRDQFPNPELQQFTRLTVKEVKSKEGK